MSTPTKASEFPKVTGKRKRAEVETKECVICIETKPVYRNFPDFTTCSHHPDTCSSCVAKQTVTLLEASRGKGWSVCKCPQCDVVIPEEELHGALPRALVKDMKEMVDKAHHSADDSWRWCLAEGCGHGSLQDGRNEMIRCRKCDYKMCFKHQIPWHRGYTCLEYETSHPQAAITKTSEEMVRKMSKPCPGCGIAVEKDGGCNHMNCE
jgi:IBR domain, a half RING-finger domain